TRVQIPSPLLGGDARDSFPALSHPGRRGGSSVSEAGASGLVLPGRGRLASRGLSAPRVTLTFVRTSDLTTPRRERRGFRPSRARVPVSPAPAPGNVRSRGPQPKSDSTSAGIAGVAPGYGTTCRIFCTHPPYSAVPGAPPRPEVRGFRTGGYR